MKPVWLLGICLVPSILLLGLEFTFQEPRDPFASTRVFLIAGCFAYGFLRVATFHPLYRPAYHAWLVSTKWSSRLPLPFGTVSFRSMDLIIIAPMLIGLIIQVGPLPPLLYAVGGYVAALTITLEHSSNKRALRMIVFLSGLLLLASFHERWAAIAMLPLLSVALYSHRRVLAKMSRLIPIHNITSNNRVRVVRIGKSAPEDFQRIGFPFDQTSPIVRHPMLRVFDAPWSESLIRALLFGWLVFAVGYRLGFGNGYEDWEMEQRLAVSGIGVFIAAILGVIRIVCYLARHRSPLGPVSRLRRRQFLIPEFDVVFFAPVATIVLTATAGLFTARIGLHPSLIIGIMATVSWFCTFSWGPGYEKWHFTGGHRMDPRFGQ